jgi:predicted acetyltransferase
MEVKLYQVQLEDREILANLLEKYDYEFSQYDNRDVNKLGLYGYPYLDSYWLDDDRYAYFIKVDDKLAGFIMVNNYQPEGAMKTDFQIAEFFVLFKYRRSGVGKQAFYSVLDKHKGRCGLGWHPKNIASAQFWEKSINEYTDGKFEITRSYPLLEYPDGTFGDVCIFDNM